MGEPTFSSLSRWWAQAHRPRPSSNLYSIFSCPFSLSFLRRVEKQKGGGARTGNTQAKSKFSLEDENFFPPSLIMLPSSGNQLMGNGNPPPPPPQGNGWQMHRPTIQQQQQQQAITKGFLVLAPLSPCCMPEVPTRFNPPPPPPHPNPPNRGNQSPCSSPPSSVAATVGRIRCMG